MMPELASPVQQPQPVFACRFRHNYRARARTGRKSAPDWQVAELVYI